MAISCPTKCEIPSRLELEELMEEFPVGGLVEVRWVGSGSHFDPDDSDAGLDIIPPEHAVVVEHLVQSAFYTGPRIIGKRAVLPFLCLFRGRVTASTTFSARPISSPSVPANT